VINVGAVNCQDNRWICSNNGIRSYPSLVLFLKDRRVSLGAWRKIRAWPRVRTCTRWSLLHASHCVTRESCCRERTQIDRIVRFRQLRKLAKCGDKMAGRWNGACKFWMFVTSRRRSSSVQRLQTAVNVREALKAIAVCWFLHQFD